MGRKVKPDGFLFFIKFIHIRPFWLRIDFKALYLNLFHHIRKERIFHRGLTFIIVLSVSEEFFNSRLS